MKRLYTEPVIFKTTPDIKEKLRIIAKRRSTKMSQALRDMVIEETERNERADRREKAS